MTDEQHNTDKPGGVLHDTRGNAVWQWAVDAGRQALDSTSALLKRLEVPGLRLEDDREKYDPQQSPFSVDADRPGTKPAGRAGYDPYGGRGGGTVKPHPAPKPPAPVVNKPVVPVREPPAARPSLLGRLFGKR
jgi:hypothetical protein